MNNSQAKPPKHISIEEALRIAKGHEQQGELPKARALYAQILRSFPDQVQARAALRSLGPADNANGEAPQELISPLLALSQQNEHSSLAEGAIALLRDFPQSFTLWTLLGSANFNLSRFEYAEECARRAVTLRPDSAAAHFNLGNALRTQDKANDALASYDEALRLDPKLAVAHHHRGVLHVKNGDTAKALEAADAAIQVAPNFADAHHVRAVALSRIEDFDGAISSFEKAIELNPKLAEAFDGLGNVYFAKGELKKAADALERAVSLNPDLESSCSLKLWVDRHLCNFSAAQGIAVKEELSVFSALAIEDDPARQLKRSVKAWQDISRHIKPLPLPARPKVRPDKLRVGYLSADFHDHATMHLMSGMLREHDGSRFDVHLYSYGKETSGLLRHLLSKNNLQLHDVEPLPDKSFVELARSHGLDIAIDVKGYTQDSRSQLFAHRLAPIQMNYLAYPGTMGSDVFDYIVADKMLIPDECREFYAEKILYLPHSYQPNDNRRHAAERKTTRSDFGLPKKGTVFCCFNASYKIGQREFDIWMRVLARVKGSVLWLLRSNEWMEQNLRDEAAARGIDPDRLILVDRALHAEHLARHKHADLFLDTFNCNAHTTASDALWAGVPVVTKAGRQFSARVGASLLNAVGLPDLITETDEEYEAKIVQLATHPGELKEVKQRLARDRLTHPLFDTKRYTRDFEAGLQLAYDRYFAGEKLADIMVPDPG